MLPCLKSRDSDPHLFQCGSATGCRILGQCGSGYKVLMTKNHRILRLKKSYFFFLKIAIYLFLVLYMKNIHATEGVFSPQKRTFSTSKHESFHFFLFYLVTLAFWVRKRTAFPMMIPNRIQPRKSCGSIQIRINNIALKGQ
jgi:hypothetical protein